VHVRGGDGAEAPVEADHLHPRHPAAQPRLRLLFLSAAPNESRVRASPSPRHATRTRPKAAKRVQRRRSQGPVGPKASWFKAANAPRGLRAVPATRGRGSRKPMCVPSSHPVLDLLHSAVSCACAAHRVHAGTASHHCRRPCLARALQTKQPSTPRASSGGRAGADEALITCFRVLPSPGGGRRERSSRALCQQRTLPWPVGRRRLIRGEWRLASRGARRSVRHLAPRRLLAPGATKAPSCATRQHLLQGVPPGRIPPRGPAVRAKCASQWRRPTPQC
jgi:hypothetical protein